MTRILAFTDPHGDLGAADAIVELARRARPDLIVCAGDFTYFGTRFERFLDRLRELGTEILYVSGNHENEDSARAVECWYPFMKCVEYQVLEKAGVRVGGLPGTAEFWPGEAADYGAVTTATGMLQHAPGSPFILLSHYPPWMSKISGVSVMTPDSGGSKTVLRILDSLKPALLVCGHYHQDFRKEDRIGATRLVNPGPSGMILEV